MEEDIYLKNAIEIKNWIENSESKEPPSKSSKNKDEKNLAKQLNIIRKKLIKPYSKIKTEKKKEAFEKRYPEIQKIISIINEIDNSIMNKNQETEQIMEESNNKESENEEINIEIDDSEFEIEFNEKNDKHCDLADLIKKDLSARKMIEKANELKQQYRSE